MYEARLIQGSLLKKIIEAVRELVTDANLDCSESGISMQAMDSSHVSLCALMIRSDGFDHYRCDRSLSLGLSMSNISKILKCAGNEDTVTLKAEDTADTLTIMFESQSESCTPGVRRSRREGKKEDRPASSGEAEQGCRSRWSMPWFPLFWTSVSWPSVWSLFQKSPNTSTPTRSIWFWRQTHSSSCKPLRSCCRPTERAAAAGNVWSRFSPMTRAVSVDASLRE